MTNKFELHFCLDVEDEWPPVSIEGVLVTAVEGQFRIETPPLFVKGLSVGDILNVNFDSEKNVTSWQHVSRSNRSTIWLMRLSEPANIEKTLDELESHHCQVIKLPSLGSYSIDVPESCEMKIIDECLAQLNEDKVAIAYPSFRHPD